MNKPRRLMSAFDSESLFTAFDQVGWNKASAPDINAAYEQLPDESPTDQIRRLQLENNKLRRTVQLLTPPKVIKESEAGPLCQINFYHNQLSRHHKDHVIRLVSNFLKDAEHEREMDLFDPLPYQKSSIELPSKGEDYDEFRIIQSVQIFPEGYVLDKIGEPLGPFEPTDAHWSLPEYQSLYKDLLTENSEEDLLKIEANKKKMAKCCFNCGSTECSIAKCPHPKNPAEINRRKEEFNAMFGSMGTPRPIGNSRRGPNVRLFEASESHTNDKRFSKFKPGEISDDLRQMISLKKDQLPPWIYNMRKMGYPPGWLNEALVRESGVAVQEEGEVNEISISGNGIEKKVVGIDAGRIILYKGYNCEMPEGVTDKPFRGAPKFHERDSVESFLTKYCKDKKIERISKKRKISEQDEVSKKLKMEESETDEEVESAEEDEVKQEFVPGWVKNETPEEEETGISNKGLPSRDKWSSGVVSFAHDAYQPEPTKTGAYSKLKKSLKKKK